MPEAAEGVIDAIENVTGLNHTAAAIALAVLVLLALFIFTKPLRFALKVLINTAIGFVALMLINYFGADFGISLGLNWTNAAVTGILGVPGVAILLTLKWLGKI